MSEPSPNANRRRLRRWAPPPTRSPRNRRRVHPVHIACPIPLTRLAGFRPSGNLPLLTLRNVGPVHLGSRLRLDVMQPALACLRLTAKDRPLLWKINVDGPHELCLNMKVPSRSSPTGKTLRIRLGRPEDLALKL